MRSKSIIGPALNHTRSNLVNGGKSTRGAPEILFLKLFATSVQRDDLADRPTALIAGRNVDPAGTSAGIFSTRIIIGELLWFR
jgi:hypothetical protein